MKAWLLISGAVAGVIAVVVNFIKERGLLELGVIAFISLSIVGLILFYVKLKGDAQSG